MAAYRLPTSSPFISATVIVVSDTGSVKPVGLERRRNLAEAGQKIVEDTANLRAPMVRCWQ
jgi:hypothetical protein